MKLIPVLLVLVFWVISQVIKASRKNAQRPRGGQNTNNSANQGQNFAEQLRQFANSQSAQGSAASASNQRSVTQDYSITDPFEEEQEYVSVSAEHFREERLVEEYKRLHAKGQTIKHHKHNYFDEEGGRKKAERHQGGRRSKKINVQPSSNKAMAIKGKAKKTRKSEGSGPFSVNKNSLKQAIIQAEIIRRPEDRW